MLQATEAKGTSEASKEGAQGHDAVTEFITEGIRNLPLGWKNTKPEVKATSGERGGFKGRGLLGGGGEVDDSNIQLYKVIFWYVVPFFIGSSRVRKGKRSLQ